MGNSRRNRKKLTKDRIDAIVLALPEGGLRAETIEGLACEIHDRINEDDRNQLKLTPNTIRGLLEGVVESGQVRVERHASIKMIYPLRKKAQSAPKAALIEGKWWKRSASVA